MALVTYVGRASRIRIAGGLVLIRMVPTEVPPAIARGLSQADFDVVQASPRPRTRTTTPKKPRRAPRPKQKES